MSGPETLRRLQADFTRHLRDPERAPAPAGVDDRGLAVYRRLVFNNVARHLAQAFPVLRRTTADDRWHALVRDYLARHRSRSPYFPRMPLEFLAYLEWEREDPDDPPWMLELAHYEWTKRAVAIDPREIDWNGVDRGGDLLRGIPVASPLVATLTYAWPVHRVGRDPLPGSPPPRATHLVIHRDSRDRVRYLETNPVGARLLDLIRERPAPGRALLEKIAAELSHPDPEVVVEGGRELLEALRAREVVLGARAAGDTTTAGPG